MPRVAGVRGTVASPNDIPHESRATESRKITLISQPNLAKAVVLMQIGSGHNQTNFDNTYVVTTRRVVCVRFQAYSFTLQSVDRP